MNRKKHASLRRQSYGRFRRKITTGKTHARVNCFLVYLAALLASSLLTPYVLAAGNAHVVNDADVGPAGKCSIETWRTYVGTGSNLATVSPICISKAAPNLEINATMTRQTQPDEDTATSVGPGFKLMLRPTDTGVGVGVAGNINWHTREHYWDNASLVMPVSMMLNDRFQLNLNVGWSYERNSTHKHAAFYGTQITAGVNDQISLMAEVFQRRHNAPGSQVGLRWMAIKDKLDLDLIIGRKVDGTSPRAVTVGLTYRH